MTEIGNAETNFQPRKTANSLFSLEGKPSRLSQFLSRILLRKDPDDILTTLAKKGQVTNKSLEKARIDSASSGENVSPEDIPDSHFLKLSREEDEALKQQQWDDVKELDYNDPRRIIYYRRFPRDYQSPIPFDPKTIPPQRDPFAYYAVDNSKMNELRPVLPYTPKLELPQGTKLGIVVGYHYLEKAWGNLLMEMFKRQVQYNRNQIEFIVIQNRDVPTGPASEASIEEMRHAVRERGLTHIIDLHEQITFIKQYIEGSSFNPRFREPVKSGSQAERTLDPFIPVWMIEQYYKGYIYPQLQYAVNDQIKKIGTLIETIAKDSQNQ